MDTEIRRHKVETRVVARSTSPPQDHIAKLRKQLREAEIEEALTSVTATMRGIVTSPGDGGNLQLGPTITAEVVFEGTPVRALLDTGSLVTIISLEFVLKALAAKRPGSQSPSEWKQAVKARLETPTVQLRSYGGGELNIVSQMTARLSNERNRWEGVIHIQKGAPVDLLVGTDVQPQLGFLFLESGQDTIATNLLDGKRWNLSEAQTQPVTHQPQEESLPAEAAREGHNETPGVVRLIQATRLPARHSKLVRARVDYRKEAPFTLFEPRP